MNLFIGWLKLLIGICMIEAVYHGVEMGEINTVVSRASLRRLA